MGLPYKWGHYAAAAVFVVTVVGFWPTFLASLGDAPLAFHVHGVTAMTWIILVGLQSYSIHTGRKMLHRRVGVSSLFLFPLLIVGFIMIVNVSAEGFLVPEDPFYQHLGPAFGWGLAIPLLAYLWLYFQALRNRRNVYLHAGYMLSTIFLLWEPPVVRIIIRYVPSMSVEGPGDFQNISDGIAISIAMAMVAALLLYLRNPRLRKPFLVVAVFMGVQISGFLYFADTQWWRATFRAYAGLPAGLTVSIGLILGSLIAWLGWRGPARAHPAPRVSANN